jgi:hypothetical protein
MGEFQTAAQKETARYYPWFQAPGIGWQACVGKGVAAAAEGIL